jgi:hypothetical protein
VSVTSAFETGVSTGGSRGSGQRKWMLGQGERAHAWLGGDWRRGTRRGCRQTSVPQRQIRSSATSSVSSSACVAPSLPESDSQTIGIADRRPAVSLADSL